MCRAGIADFPVGAAKSRRKWRWCELSFLFTQRKMVNNSDYIKLMMVNLWKFVQFWNWVALWRGGSACIETSMLFFLWVVWTFRLGSVLKSIKFCSLSLWIWFTLEKIYLIVRVIFIHIVVRGVDFQSRKQTTENGQRIVRYFVLLWRKCLGSV